MFVYLWQRLGHRGIKKDDVYDAHLCFHVLFLKNWSRAKNFEAPRKFIGTTQIYLNTNTRRRVLEVSEALNLFFLSEINMGKKDTNLSFAENFMLSGAAAVISKTAAAPIERIKLLVQNQVSLFFNPSSTRNSSKFFFSLFWCFLGWND